MQKLTQIIFILFLVAIFSSTKVSAITMSSESFDMDATRFGSGEISIINASSASFDTETSFGVSSELTSAPTPTPAPTPASGLGAAGGGGGILIEKFISEVSVTINNGAAVTNSRIVTLTLDGGPAVKRMAISNSNDFSLVGQDTYVTSRIWILTEGAGTKTVYVTFYNESGNASGVATDNIQFTLATLTPEAEFADIDKDGDIDLFDFNLLIVNWASTECDIPADLDGNCIVDIFDFNFLMIYWSV